MAFRTVIVDTHSKLEYSLGYLVFRTTSETKRVVLEEIHTLIVNSTAVSLTSSLLVELSKRKIKVIFCDEKHNPSSELVSCYGNNLTSKRIKEQINWSPITADECWLKIIKQKIKNQSKLLRDGGKLDPSLLLDEYAKDVEPGDITNREGHAAKVYFNNIFYDGFKRSEDCSINAALNYGYSIFLSEINRCVVSAGFLTQLGIHHKNEFNDFNLSCDLIEPLRYFVDKKAKCLNGSCDFKPSMVSVLETEVMIGGRNQSMINAINIYINSFFDAMSSNDPEKIRFVYERE